MIHPMMPEQSRTDDQLIERFLAGAPGEAESAFEALVTRHGPMVMGVCRQILPQSHDAEDAFQVTFLTLMRNAGKIRNPRVLGGWLHRVAWRTAVDMRTQAARRCSLSARAGQEDSSGGPENDFARNELRLILQAELDRLPEKYRTLVEHCYLEGKTNEEVARLVGCPVGTIKGRLWRARAMLRVRLLRRGGLAPDRSLCLQG
jgi:RNA polymerase sigma factor (sigma-70 family)